MKAIHVHTHGEANVLVLDDIPEPSAGAGEVLIRQEAIGLNFIDTYQRSGLYKVDLPFIPGMEGAGEVIAVGEGVSEIREGMRVAYAGVPGAYRECTVLPADRVVPVPEGVSSEQAAALMLQGMTAHYLVFDSFPLSSGDHCLVHAAAGGVGLLLVQLAKRRGATVYGTVSTDEKAELARAAGADEIIFYTKEDVIAAVKRFTADKGVDVVYDSVGKDTFESSLKVLRPRGYFVSYGQSSGPIGMFDPLQLSQNGSLFFTRPTLFHHIADRESLLQRAQYLFELVKEGCLEIRIGARFPLAEAREAHQALEGRKTSGKVLLIP